MGKKGKRKKKTFKNNHMMHMSKSGLRGLHPCLLNELATETGGNQWFG